MTLDNVGSETPLATENKEVSVLQKIVDGLQRISTAASSGNIDSKKLVAFLEPLIAEANEAIKGVTDGSIKEDVDMSIDQIEKEPDAVQKLSDKDININLVDKQPNGQINKTSTY